MVILLRWIVFKKKIVKGKKTVYKVIRNCVIISDKKKYAKSDETITIMLEAKILHCYSE